MPDTVGFDASHHRTALFLWEGMPNPFGIASSVVLYRHLRGLQAAGWRIIVATREDRLNEEGADSCEVIGIPDRKPFWTPFRLQHNFLVRRRIQQWSRHVQRRLGGAQPDVVISVLAGPFALVAAELASRMQAPLGLFVHDAWENWGHQFGSASSGAEWSQRVLSRAAWAWPASSALAHRVRVVRTGDTSLLWPLPGSHAGSHPGWRPEFARQPTVVAAGSGYHADATLVAVARALAPLGGRLIVVGSNFPRGMGGPLLEQEPNVALQAPFPTGEECVRFVREQAAAFLIPYPLFGVSRDDVEYVRDSFPSRLIEFSHTGLPILVTAPPDFAVSRWASARSWEGLVTEPSEAALENVLRRLTDETAWRRMAAQTQAAAREEFDPDRIQHQFESDLEAMLAAKQRVKINSGEACLT